MNLPRLPRVPRFRLAAAALFALAIPALAADPATNETPDPAPLLRRLRDETERFDPAYDADIELEARRRAERNARDAAHPGEGSDDTGDMAELNEALARHTLSPSLVTVTTNEVRSLSDLQNPPPPRNETHPLLAVLFGPPRTSPRGGRGTRTSRGVRGA